MKRSVAVMLSVFTLVFMNSSAAGVGWAKTKRNRAHVVSSPTVVPGTELHGNVAKVKPGYRFVQRENGVGVINLRTNANIGTYTCPCKSTDPNRKCELIFSPIYITCKGGSCGGVTSCLLVGNVPSLRSESYSPGVHTLQMHGDRGLAGAEAHDEVMSGLVINADDFAAFEN